MIQNSDPSIRANYGEWSELVVLADILSKSGIFEANSNGKPNPDCFLRVSAITLTEGKNQSQLKYLVHQNDIEILRDGENVSRVDKSHVETLCGLLKSDLLSKSNKKTFALKSGGWLLDLLERRTISASSSQQISDMQLEILDEVDASVKHIAGFSVKSKLGNAPTLLNATGATNFMFQIEPKVSDASLAELGQMGPKVTVSNLLSDGHTLVFKSLVSQQFQSNIEMVDSQLPGFIAKVLLSYYSSSLSTVVDLVSYSLDGENSAIAAQKQFKLKQFLGAISMGMRPSVPWDGDPTKFQGNIVLNEDAQCCVYYRRNLADFQDYLFHETRLETPSTSRHKFGSIEVIDGNQFINLNLQIRFQ